MIRRKRAMGSHLNYLSKRSLVLYHHPMLCSDATHLTKYSSPRTTVEQLVGNLIALVVKSLQKKLLLTKTTAFLLWRSQTLVLGRKTFGQRESKKKINIYWSETILTYQLVRCSYKTDVRVNDCCRHNPP